MRHKKAAYNLRSLMLLSQIIIRAEIYFLHFPEYIFHLKLFQFFFTPALNSSFYFTREQHSQPSSRHKNLSTNRITRGQR